MGKTIEELFKTKQLPEGKTAAEKYEIRNSKDIILRSSTGAMDLPFKIAQVARKNISSRLRETRLEEETTGLRIISKLGAPIIYGTDIFKLSTQKTEMVTEMKNSVNTNNASNDSGILGNLFEKGKTKGLELLSKIGVQLPKKLIPTRISLNEDFKKGKEPDTMTTLAKIKKDGAGNLVGKLLAQNAKGTPKQIANNVLGAGIGLLKGEIKKKLFGAAKQAAQNLAKKGDSEVQYDSSAKYSDTINPYDEDYFKRNDLSSVLVAKDTKFGADDTVKKKVDELVPRSKDPINVSKNPFAKLQDKLKDVKGKAEEKLSEAKKQGQQAIASGKKIGDTKNGPTNLTDAKIKYSETVDETADEIKLRNDLSSKLEALNTAVTEMKNEPNTGPKRKQTYSSFKNIKAKTLSTQFGIDKKDFLNEKTPYDNTSLKLKDNTNLDDYDFITFKFHSISQKRSANFRATLTGVSENISPSWDSAKFIGSPFNYYTYSGIERSLTFSFKVYALSPKEHISNWQRLNFLTDLTYPQKFIVGGTFTPTFIKITIGNLYKEQECFIESLSYTFDDNVGWNIGSPTSVGISDKAKFKIDGEVTSIDNYKLPSIIDVTCTVKLVESKVSVFAKNYYGFDKLPRLKGKDGKGITSETTSDAEVVSNSNNTAVLELLEVEDTNPQPKENTTAQNAAQSSPGSESSTEKKPSVENSSTATAQTKKPINYRIEASNNGDGFTGRVYADGVSIFKQDYVSTFSHFSDKEYKGADGVKETLKFNAKHFGFYSENGKYYEKSDNIN